MKVYVADHLSPSYIGKKGTVYWETRNLLIIRDEESGELKKILKKGGVFIFQLPDSTQVVVRGEEILARPEDRLRKLKTRR